MTHLPTDETFDLLLAYFVGPERKWVANFRRRSRSRNIRRATRAATSQLRHVDRKTVTAVEFSDPESCRVLDAIADALTAPLAIQQAREDHFRWLANSRK